MTEPSRRRGVCLVLLTVLTGCADLSGDAGGPGLHAAVAELEAQRQTLADDDSAGAQLSTDESRALRGEYVAEDGAWVEIFDVEGTAFLRAIGVPRAPLRRRDARVVAWIAPGAALEIERSARNLIVDGRIYARAPELPPAPPAIAIAAAIGIYEARDEVAGTVVRAVVHERHGELYLQVGDAWLSRLEDVGRGGHRAAPPLGTTNAVRMEAAGEGRVPRLTIGDNSFERVVLSDDVATSFRIEPVRPVEDLRATALAAAPPSEAGDFRAADLVDLEDAIPGLRLDVRYATSNNFMGAVFYDEPRAFMQRPAAAALSRVQAELARRGLGLLVHDAYRPWYVTRMFWDATPAAQKQFVADPANGSRHNRGSAVDLTLVYLDTGEPVEMTGGYDEFSERSYPFFVGGSSRQRWYREVLRRAMEAEGFAVYDFEWWHFDHQDWRHYPILNTRFDGLG